MRLSGDAREPGPAPERRLVDVAGGAAALGRGAVPAARFPAAGGPTLPFLGFCHFAEPRRRDVFLV